jgi:aminodeoxyfutalosine synthase
MPLTELRKAELAEKVAAGERLDYTDGVDLYAADDLAWLGGLAHGVRTAKNADITYFNVNRHLNLTNVCSASCAYCSFERKPGQADAYTMRVEEAVEKALAMKDEGITERPAPDIAVALLPPGAAGAEGGGAAGRAQGVHRH